MNWFVWRQHRKQFLVFGVLLALFAGILIPTGIQFWNTYQHALSTCAQHPQALSCSDLADSLFTSQTDGFIKIGAVLGTFALPVLLGLFIGSPLIAREYEEGTNKLAWTQSVSRHKWLTTKLIWALAFACIYGIVLAILATWWSRSLNALAQYRFIPGHFETQGLMPVAYSLFFTSIAFMAGAWFRKTLLAMAITFGVFVLSTATFAQLIRPHYMTPVTVTSSMGPSAVQHKIPTGAWVLSRDIVDSKGKVFDSFDIANMPPQCQKFTQNIQISDSSRAAKAKLAGGDPVDDCLNQAGYHQTATYQPSYRYWDFQRIEAGIYLGMATVAVAATYLLVLRRDA